MINPKNNDEKCFKWAATAVLHHEDLKHHPGGISLLQHYEDQYNWNELEFPQENQKIGRFERNNPGIAINVLFNKKESIYAARRSDDSGWRK